jgi:hypothetical protein
VALFTTARFPLRALGRVLAARMGLDGLRLRGVPGLRFARLLGTAKGGAFGPWEPRRWASLLVFESPAALDAFEATSPVARAWGAEAEESYRLRLAPLTWHGTWGGVDPFAGAPRQPVPPEAPLLVLTRARIRPRHLRTFRAAAREVEAGLRGAEGLLVSVGAGETPLRNQATFSLWASAAQLQRFAYGEGSHPGVVRRTNREGWYAEQLFARLTPLAASGTWDGSDPLAAALRTGAPARPAGVSHGAAHGAADGAARG